MLCHHHVFIDPCGMSNELFDVYSVRGNLVNQLLASDTTVSHLLKALPNVFQSSRHESMLHRFHFATPKKIGPGFQVSRIGLVFVRHG